MLWRFRSIVWLKYSWNSHAAIIYWCSERYLKCLFWFSVSTKSSSTSEENVSSYINLSFTQCRLQREILMPEPAEHAGVVWLSGLDWILEMVYSLWKCGGFFFLCSKVAGPGLALRSYNLQALLILHTEGSVWTDSTEAVTVKIQALYLLLALGEITNVPSGPRQPEHAFTSNRLSAKHNNNLLAFTKAHRKR